MYVPTELQGWACVTCLGMLMRHVKPSTILAGPTCVSEEHFMGSTQATIDDHWYRAILVNTGAAAVAFTPAMTPLLARTFRSSSAAILQGQSGDRLVRSKQIFSCLRWGHNLAAGSPSPLRQSFCWSCLSMARSTAALATAWAGCRWWTVASGVAFHSGGRGVGVLPYDGRIVAYRKGCGQASDNWKMNTSEIGVLDPANKDMAKP